VTPNFAVLGIATPTRHLPRLWIPLFLLWIPIILLSPLIFLALAAVAIVTRTTVWRLIALCWGILSGLPGTDVRVHADDNHVLIRVL
jgi:hypothetical protein